MTHWKDAEYTLYSSPFSLYSMMARHTVQLGPTTHNAMPPKSITLSFVNHKAHENLNEEYLKINPKGQVPAMTGNLLDHTLTDSYSISLHLAEKHYPAMLGGPHEDVVRGLFERLHAVKSGTIDQDDEWTFGAEVGPTILDSHILPFALRCMEVGNGLVPPELQRWAKAKEKSPLWYKVMRGRPTTYHPSMGPVAEMQDMMTL
ncbi:hypothetical protein QYS62_010635 [Fusarium acuminatum]|uniref:GST N-terminal domain-containing protein n=1 Tax=Fusarium acuminatum TaxID=5515 RepID=A0ABZ2X8U1_9HYPO